MSQARIYTTKKVQKDWKCGKCGAAIRKGVDGRISFAVGFRGREQTRCLKQECYPSRSERESSAVASVYDAQDSADLSTAETAGDLTGIRDEIADAVQEVADEYEQNEMFEINEDLQERVQILTDAADALREWEPDTEAPEAERDCDECDGTGRVDGEEDCDECEGTGQVSESAEALGKWLETQRESLQDAIDGMELP